MKLSFIYDGARQQIEIDDRCVESIIRPRSPGSIDEVVALQTALENPAGGTPLADFVRNRSHILLVVNDATRPTPTRLILETIWPILEGKRVSVVVATGTHRPPTESEYLQMFGKLRETLRARTQVHDARVSPSFPLGTTRYGNKIRLNAILREVDAVIPIGSIEPHYFAGYTGGRKSFMPGLATYDAIEANHRLALSPMAAAVSLATNPVAEELEDVEAMLVRDFNIFAIMTVLDREHRIYAAACGCLRKSFSLLTRKADDIYVAPIARQADIVVSIALPPTDADFYQAHKAMEHGKYALRDGGILILVAACREGIGPGNFMDLLVSGESREDIVKKMTNTYRLGHHKAAKIADFSLKSQIWAVTRLSSDLLERVHIRPFDCLSEAMDQAFGVMGGDARLVVLLDGGHMVPKLI